MSGLFFELGRKLGRATIPAARKGKWVWTSLAGTEAEAIRAETKLGRAMAAEMRLGLGASDNPGDAELVREICRRLSARVHNKVRSFQAEVIRTGSPTALALPGGFIFVDVWLLNLCERQADEVAFVVGHEMAHVIRGHAFDRFITQVGLDVVSSLLSRGALSPWLRQTGLRLLQSSYSQDNELEADELGLRLAQAAGYHPAGALRLLARLGQRQGASQAPADWLASHPPAPQRAANLKAALG
jgi:predicted Zn-dependent protease